MGESRTLSTFLKIPTFYSLSKYLIIYIWSYFEIKCMLIWWLHLYCLFSSIENLPPNECVPCSLESKTGMFCLMNNGVSTPAISHVTFVPIPAPAVSIWRNAGLQCWLFHLISSVNLGKFIFLGLCFFNHEIRVIVHVAMFMWNHKTLPGSQ